MPVLSAVLTYAMAAVRIDAETADGYKRFNDNINNINYYGTNSINATPIIHNGASEYQNEIGSRSSLNRDANHGERVLYGPEPDDRWEMNYHEAAIFLEEGENNEKFDSHPREPEALPAYLLVHNGWYYGLDLFASLLLLILAFTEDPAVPLFKLPVGVHGSIELLTLSLIGVEVALKLRWIGWGTILKHKRTMIKCVTLAIMFMEAVIVIIRQSSHFRVTRALRPIFLVDTRFCGGVRRFIRQILQSLPPILDMFGLLLFFIGIYSLLGFYLFSEINSYFVTISDSFVSMFVLLTTANFPDVMMPSYAKSKWNVLFFVSYIATVLYVLMNLMLAVVYESFTRIERDKFRKLLLHKRRACQLAFRMLVSKQNPHHMRFKQFEGLMRYYAPLISTRDVVLMFKQLNTSNSGALSVDEFLGVYDAVTIKWEAHNSQQLWFDSLTPPVRSICRIAHTAVKWPYFEYVIYAIIVGNGLAMFIRLIEPANSLLESAYNFCASWDSVFFISLFIIEAVMRMLALGMSEYLSSGWNVYDLLVTLSALLGLLIIRLVPEFVFAVFLRPLRLIRLYKIKKRYRDVFGTLVLLSPLMCSTAIVMLVAYYFFAIIGMELFAGYDMKNCCINSTVEDFYKYSANASTALGYYYLNNFQNMINSGVTLFELAVVNNWFITMNGYAIVAGQYSRLFFMLFYLCMLILLTIIVASVLEAFRFRIQYKRQTSKRDEERMLHEEVEVRWDELQNIVQDFHILESLRSEITMGTTTIFIGKRPRTKDVLQRRMYMTEIKEWLTEADLQERSDEATPLDSLRASEQTSEDLIHARIDP